MAYIEPNSELRLLAGINIDQDYNHTLFFNSRERQAAFFKSRTVKTFDKLSYQRKERGYIRVNCIPEEVYGCNYMMYKNTNFDPQNLERWIYCFVESIEYINNNCAEIRYTVDRIQTWMFDYKLGDCLVDREHTLTDEVDEHLTPEPVAPFEFTIDNGQDTSKTKVYERFAATVALKRKLKSANVAGADQPLDAWTPYTEIGTSSGDVFFYTGLGIDVPLPSLQSYFTSFTNLNPQQIGDTPSTLNPRLSDFLFGVCKSVYSAYDGLGSQSTNTTVDDIIEITIMPIEAFRASDVIITSGIPQFSETTIDVSRPTVFTYADETYSPRNAKLLNAPFCGLTLSDLGGNNTQFKFELFTDTLFGKYVFNQQYTLVGDGISSISPTNYINKQFYSLSTVVLNFNLKTFYQNSNVADYMRNNKMAMIGSVLSAGAGILGGVFTYSSALQGAEELTAAADSLRIQASGYKPTGRIAKKLTREATQLSAEATQMKVGARGELQHTVDDVASTSGSNVVSFAMGALQASFNSNKIYGGTTDANAEATTKRLGYTVYTTIPVLESAKQIDDYFDRFGYKLLTTHRPYVDEAKTGDRPVSDLRGVWNYIKTVDCVVHHANPDSAAIGYSAQDEAIIASIYNKGITFWFDNEKIGDYNTYRNANSIFNPQPGPTPPPVPTTKNGIDISRVNVNCYWNDEIDNWSPVTAFDMESVKNSGGDYALLRIGGADEYGDTTDVQQGFYFDGAFESSYQAARAAGLKVGAYYLVNCMTVQEAVAEVNHIVSLFQQFDYPVLEGGFWLDIELNAVPEGKTRRFTSASARVQNAMIAELKAGIVNGIAPYAETFVGLYTNPSGLEHYGFKSLSVYAQTPLWLAYWSDYYDKGNPPEYILEKIRQLPDYPAIWQYGQNKLGVRAYNGTLVDGDYIYPPGWTPSQQ